MSKIWLQFCQETYVQYSIFLKGKPGLEFEIYVNVFVLFLEVCGFVNGLATGRSFKFVPNLKYQKVSEFSPLSGQFDLLIDAI